MYKDAGSLVRWDAECTSGKFEDDGVVTPSNCHIPVWFLPLVVLLSPLDFQQKPTARIQLLFNQD